MGRFTAESSDLVWEVLTVKDAKINFDSQLEKFEEAIPSADDYDLYGVYPAIDACVALSEVMHSRLSGETPNTRLKSVRLRLPASRCWK